MGMSSMDRFFVLLGQVPRIARLWNQEKRELDIELYEASLGVLSTGEAHMARFFASVWLGGSGGTDLYSFNLVDAASSLEPEWRRLICDWLVDPFWP